MKHRILYLAYDLYSVGGIQRYSRNALRALGDLYGDEAVVACSLQPARPGGFESEIHSDVVGRGDSLTARQDFAGRVMDAAHGVDLVVCDHTALAPLGLRAARRNGAALCVVAHGIEVWGPLLPWRRRALASADVIASVSAFTRRVLAARLPKMANRIAVVHSCIDTELFVPGPSDDALRASLGVDGQHVVLTVSRLAPGRPKGQETVMRALARLRQDGHPVAYLVAGDGDDRPRLERAAQELGVSNDVRFVGRVTDEQLPDFYRLCDTFVLASGFRLGRRPEGEGLGLVALEAQSCGRPVVASALDGSAESIVDGESGLLADPNDAEGIASALRTILFDRSRREQMGAAARRSAVTRFSFDVFCARLEDVFGPLLAR